MKIIVFMGGNKETSSARLGGKLAEALSERGQEVIVAGAKGKVKVKKGLAVKEFSALRAKTIADYLSKEKADLLISLMDIAVCAAAVEVKVPFIYAEPDGFKEDKPVKDKKTLLKKAKKVLVITKDGTPFDKKRYAGLKAEAVASPAIWVEHYNYEKPAFFKKENNIVSAGKLGKDSGFDLLLESWARLAPAHPSWHLTIVGSGSGLAKAALQKFIKKHNLQDSTEVVMDDGDVYSVLRNADIFAYPAAKADDHNILLDAMACKLPCLACETEGVADLIVNGVNGLIVNEADEEAFTVALDELMVNWGKRVGLAIEAVKMKDRYPFEAFVVSFEK